MEIAVWFTLGLTLMTLISVNVKKKMPEPPKAIEAPPAKPKELEYWTEEHRLVRTWRATDKENSPGIAAWAWKCSCGGRGSASNATAGQTIGSEENAIERFKAHAKGFREANKGTVNPMKAELDKAKADLAEYRSKCYCKTTNDDLILLESRLEKES